MGDSGPSQHSDPIITALTPANLPGEDTVTRALTYPYPRPLQSYLFHRGEAHPIPPSLDVNNPCYTAVLVIGSNGSPVQLRRKYGDIDVKIPVLQVRVHNLDLVFTAGVSGYGSVSSTLVYSRGTMVNTHVTLLTKEDFTHMNRTEAGYALCKLADCTHEEDQHRPRIEFVNEKEQYTRECVFMYVSGRGPLLVDDRPVAFKDFEAENRSLAEAVEKDMIEHVMKVTATSINSTEEWIRKVVSDKQFRVDVMTVLGDKNKDFRHDEEHFTIVQQL